MSSDAVSRSEHSLLGLPIDVRRGACLQVMEARLEAVACRCSRCDKPVLLGQQHTAAAPLTFALPLYSSQVMGEAGGAAGEGNKFTADLMDQFFRDPNMQQLLYKYLPEPMRNPQTFEWMLSNPDYRKQLEGMMEQQVRIHLSR